MPVIARVDSGESAPPPSGRFDSRVVGGGTAPLAWERSVRVRPEFALHDASDSA